MNALLYGHHIQEINITIVVYRPRENEQIPAVDQGEIRAIAILILVTGTKTHCLLERLKYASNVSHELTCLATPATRGLLSNGARLSMSLAREALDEKARR